MPRGCRLPPVMLTDKLQQALTLHHMGRLDPAAALYREILLAQPGHPDAMHFLGVVALQTQQPQVAVDLIGKAIEAGAGGALAFFNRGAALQQLDRLDQAAADYDAAIALQPDFAAAHCNRAAIRLRRRQYAAALQGADRALALQPGLAKAHFNRAAALEALGREDEALASYGQAIATAPEDSLSFLVRANLLVKLKRHEAALADYQAAIRLRADFAPAHLNRANVLAEMQQWDAALAGYNQAIALDATLADAFFNRANVFRERAQWQSALEDFDRSLALREDYSEAYCNRGHLLAELHRFEEARSNYDQALRLRPDYAQARYNRSFVELLHGEFATGWLDHESRWEGVLGSSGESLNFPAPRWLGNESISGRRILLRSEQGLGDTLQFCRYANQVAALGAEVILEVQRPLVALLRTLSGAHEVVAQGGELPECDCWCPLLSLPLAFKTSLSTIPAPVPYLRSDPDKLESWKGRIGGESRLRVGLVWSGGSRPDQPRWSAINSRRNISLLSLAPLRHPRVAFYSLQKGQPAEAELAQLPPDWEGPRILDFMPSIEDFADTAAFIDALDLVISVDTATAHLAGALGKPVWILNRWDTCWRWLLDRRDSPWYPTATLYRQQSRADWSAVLAQVTHDLHRLAEQHAGRH